MNRFFNIAGPCIAGEHYMIPPDRRTSGLLGFVESKQFFVLHAARQTGKSTLLLDFSNELNTGGRYHCVYCSLENLSRITDPQRGILMIADVLQMHMQAYPELCEIEFLRDVDFERHESALQRVLTNLCARLSKPLVLLFDEADSLRDDVLLSFLRQLRNGYVARSISPFVHSVALVGMRNLRDYRALVREEGDTLGSVSPFNVIRASLTMRNFTRDEIGELYGQHTEDTGQVFPPEVIDAVWLQTAGQPWLVNAIAVEILDTIHHGDISHEIVIADVQRARDNIIINRPTHIDSLMERLREERVRKVIEPVITGESGDLDLLMDDYRYVQDLGLIVTEDGVTKPANPIYGEVMIRVLNHRSQVRMAEEELPFHLPRYMRGQELDMRFLLEDFQQFWRENSEIWSDVYTYREAAPHLILLAFLQRVVNRTATLSREFAAGRGRIDICIEHLGRKYPIELKILKDGRTIETGFRQISMYMDRMGCSEGWLMVFNRDPDVPWDQKIYWQTHEKEGRVIHLVGC